MSLQFLEPQLVGPSDKAFHYTHFQDTPCAIPGKTWRLAFPCLSHFDLKESQLVTSPCLSLHGIYIHRPTGLTLVYAADRQSFAVRKLRYELQYVVNMMRSGRPDADVDADGAKDKRKRRRLSRGHKKRQTGRPVVGEDYLEPLSKKVLEKFNPVPEKIDELISASTLLQDIEAIESLYGFEVPESVDGDVLCESHLIPLLPIFTGYTRVEDATSTQWGEYVHAVDFSNEDYLRYLVPRMDSLVLYQSVYFIVQRIRKEVVLDGLPTISECISALFEERGVAWGDKFQKSVVKWYRDIAELQDDDEYYVEREPVCSQEGSQGVSRSGAQSQRIQSRGDQENLNSSEVQPEGTYALLQSPEHNTQTQTPTQYTDASEGEGSRAGGSAVDSAGADSYEVADSESAAVETPTPDVAGSGDDSSSSSSSYDSPYDPFPESSSNEASEVSSLELEQVAETAQEGDEEADEEMDGD